MKDKIVYGLFFCVLGMCVVVSIICIAMALKSNRVSVSQGITGITIDVDDSLKLGGYEWQGNNLILKFEKE